jgi:hypothetical protein
MKKSCLFGISTLCEKETVFAKMLELEEFDSYRVCNICEDCLALGVSEECVHKKHCKVSWIGGDNSIRNKLFPGDSDLAREMEGVPTESNRRCFSKHSIDRMMSRPRVEMHDLVRHVYVIVDPVAGSDIPNAETSDYVILSMCSPNTTLVGLDALSVRRHEDYEDILYSHLCKIRQLPYFESATLILDVESGTGLEASHAQSIIRRLPDVQCIDDFKEKPGTQTTNQAKLDMMNLTRTLLDNDDIRILKNMITHHKNPQELMTKMKDQFLNYSRYVVVGKSMTSKNVVVLSGKGENKKEKDDVCLTFQRGIRTRHRFIYDPKFQKLH